MTRVFIPAQSGHVPGEDYEPQPAKVYDRGPGAREYKPADPKRHESGRAAKRRAKRQAERDRRGV